MPTPFPRLQARLEEGKGTARSLADRRLTSVRTPAAALRLGDGRTEPGPGAAGGGARESESPAASPAALRPLA